jgi:hypothetical protein
MENLRIVPLLMFFTGCLFVYAGFTDQAPSDILRGVLNPGGGDDTNTSYTPTSNTNYNGVTNLTYQAPSNTLNVGTF